MAHEDLSAGLYSNICGNGRGRGRQPPHLLTPFSWQGEGGLILLRLRLPTIPERGTRAQQVVLEPSQACASPTFKKKQDTFLVSTVTSVCQVILEVMGAGRQ